MAEQRIGWPANEFELAFLVSCVATGVLTLLGVTQSKGLNYSLATDFIRVWSVTVIAGSVLALTGLYWTGGQITGLKIKRLGLFACGFGLAAYAVAVLRLGPPGYMVFIFMGSFAYAALHRTVVITYRLRMIIRSASRE